MRMNQKRAFLGVSRDFGQASSHGNPPGRAVFFCLDPGLLALALDRRDTCRLGIPSPEIRAPQVPIPGQKARATGGGGGLQGSARFLGTVSSRMTFGQKCVFVVCSNLWGPVPHIVTFGQRCVSEPMEQWSGCHFGFGSATPWTNSPPIVMSSRRAAHSICKSCGPRLHEFLLLVLGQFYPLFFVFWDLTFDMDNSRRRFLGIHLFSKQQFWLLLSHRGDIWSHGQ